MDPADDRSDHFVAFVERLAADLDATPDDGTALAADAHLSRSHFERVIAAMAGESPTRFRARVLLERAAYRMITTDVRLVDLAVDARFSSHEAFTRAFTREYGAAPSAWRRRPTRFQIEAPSDVHFHPMVAHVLTFAAHHRQLAVARLRECGVTDLGFGDPKEWFARPVCPEPLGGERDPESNSPHLDDAESRRTWLRRSVRGKNPQGEEPSYDSR